MVFVNLTIENSYIVDSHFEPEDPDDDYYLAEGDRILDSHFQENRPLSRVSSRRSSSSRRQSLPPPPRRSLVKRTPPPQRFIERNNERDFLIENQNNGPERSRRLSRHIEDFVDREQDTTIDESEFRRKSSVKSMRRSNSLPPRRSEIIQHDATRMPPINEHVSSRFPQDFKIQHVYDTYNQEEYAYPMQFSRSNRTIRSPVSNVPRITEYDDEQVYVNDLGDSYVQRRFSNTPKPFLEKRVPVEHSPARMYDEDNSHRMMNGYEENHYRYKGEALPQSRRYPVNMDEEYYYRERPQPVNRHTEYEARNISRHTDNHRHRISQQILQQEDDRRRQEFEKEYDIYEPSQSLNFVDKYADENQYDYDQQGSPKPQNIGGL